MKNKIVAVATLSLITLLSFGKNITNANADIFPKPSNYLWGQYFNLNTNLWNNYKLPNISSTDYTKTTILWTRTGTTPNWDYANETVAQGTSTDGVTVTSKFVKSTTGWSPSGSDYVATTQSIGSNAGTSFTRALWTIQNGLINSYWFDIDLSSNASNLNLEIYYVTLSSPKQVVTTVNYGTNFQSIYIPMATTVYIDLAATSSARYVDGYFLRQSELGTGSIAYDQAYNQGFLDGQDVGLSSDVNFMSVLSAAMDGVGSIFNINILGSITLGSLALFPLLGIMVMFFKKVIQ